MKYRSLEAAACPILVGGCGDLKVVYLAFLTYSSAGHQHDLTASLAAAWHSRVQMAGPPHQKYQSWWFSSNPRHDMHVGEDRDATTVCCFVAFEAFGLDR